MLKTQLVAAAAILLACGGAKAQTNYDPYDPHNRGQMRTTDAAGNPSNITPSLMDFGFGTDQGNIGPFVTMPDKQFARITARRALMELRLARTAAGKSKNPDVLQVAALLTDDYTRWQAGMKKAAGNLGIPLPQDLDARQRAEVARLAALNGPEFDEAYLREVAHLQHKALAITQHEAEAGGVAGFRHWAGVMVSELQEQVRMAERGLKASALVSRR
ncbi:MAG: DUF4142 domain-containing protein [Acidobacteriota bacterium]|nr:DUF4142 domain-containing protein [Acidobacteriota bacterium]